MNDLLCLTGLDSDAKQNYRPSFMDHFDRIFEAGGRGSDSGPNGSSEEDSGGLLRGAKQEDPFKLKKGAPPDFEFVSTKSLHEREPRKQNVMFIFTKKSTTTSKQTKRNNTRTISFKLLHSRDDLTVRTTLHSFINSTAGKYCSVAFI